MVIAFNICQFTSSAAPNSTSNNCSINDSLRFILIIVLGLPLITIGIVSSLLSFCMFLKDNLTPKTTKTMLMVTAFLDFIFLCLAFFYLELKVLYQVYNLKKIEAFYIKVYVPISVALNWCEMLRNWVTVFIGLERYLIICHALDFKKWWNIKVTRIIISVTAILAAIFRIPNAIGLLTKLTQPKLSKLSYFIHDWIDAIFMNLAPILILLICSIAIAKQIRSLSSNLNSMSDSKPMKNEPRASLISTSRINLNNSSSLDKVRTKVHKMLMVVMLIFTVCAIPYLINAILKLVRGDLLFFIGSVQNRNPSTNFNSTRPITMQKYSCATKILSVICWFCSITYSTTNFFVYVCYCKKYRQIIRHMLLCEWSKIDTLQSSGTTTRNRLLSTSYALSQSRMSLCADENIPFEHRKPSVSFRDESKSSRFNRSMTMTDTPNTNSNYLSLPPVQNRYAKRFKKTSNTE